MEIIYTFKEYIHLRAIVSQEFDSTNISTESTYRQESLFYEVSKLLTWAAVQFVDHQYIASC